MAISHAILSEFSDTLAGNDARDYFGAHGIPTRRNEAYHFTDLARGLENIEKPNGEIPLANINADIIIHSTQFGEIVSGEKDGISIVPNGQIEISSEIGAKLCVGLSKSNSKITIAPNTKARIAIQRGAGSRSSVEIEIGENAQIEIIEEQAADGGLSSNLVNVNIGEGASLRRIMIMQTIGAQDLRYSTINLQKYARLDLFALCFGGKLVRIDTNVNLLGEGAIANINGAYILSNSQNDLTTTIIHHAPDCQSNEIVRGICTKGARNVFQGLIKVEKGAQKTIGKMEHRGIMLEEGAQIFAKPCLEIYADDVECSHANTIGALDDKALFYMQARGISRSKAKMLLINAFLAQVFDDIQDEKIHADIMARIDDKLGGIL